jgi:Flp pilus assembly pilin Flp
MIRSQDLVIFSPVRDERGIRLRQILKETEPVAKMWQYLWNDESGQDIAEYAVMLAVILVIVVGTIRLIGSNANNVFSNVGSSIQ